MLDVFDYLLRSFNDTTDWNDDNFYSNLTAVSRSLPSSPSSFLPSGEMSVDNRDRSARFLYSKGLPTAHCLIRR